jgi:hypothetical protein
VKWKDFGIEHNSWEPWDNVHAPELVTDFYRRHPGAARQIRAMEFNAIPFQPRVPSRHSLEGGVDVRGTRPRPASTADPAPCRRLPAPVILSTPINPVYIPPHRRLEGLDVVDRPRPAPVCMFRVSIFNSFSVDHIIYHATFN